MTKDYDVLIIDGSSHEAALAASAIMLHEPSLRVQIAETAQAALRALEAGPHPRLVILGRDALAHAAEFGTLLRNRRFAALRLIVLAPIDAQVSPDSNRAGVHAIYERPEGWPQYRDLMAGIIARWLKKREQS